MRTFLAFDIAEDVKKRIAETSARLRATDPKIRWVKVENMHITVYFFGEVEENRIPDLERIGRQGIESIEPFSVSVQGISAFPRIEKARVIWYGIRNDEGQLTKVYERVREGLRGTGIVQTIEARPYTPHLTAGRVRDRIARRLIDEIEELQDISFGSSMVSEMILFKSALTPRGAVYEKLSRFTL